MTLWNFAILFDDYSSISENYPKKWVTELYCRENIIRADRSLGCRFKHLKKSSTWRFCRASCLDRRVYFAAVCEECVLARLKVEELELLQYERARIFIRKVAVTDFKKDEMQDTASASNAAPSEYKDDPEYQVSRRFSKTAPIFLYTPSTPVSW